MHFHVITSGMVICNNTELWESCVSAPALLHRPRPDSMHLFFVTPQLSQSALSSLLSHIRCEGPAQTNNNNLMHLLLCGYRFCPGTDDMALSHFVAALVCL